MSDAEDAPTIGEHQFEVSLRSVGPGTKVFGHIRLERELGRGGMGVVWLAHDELIDLPIALKFLPDVVARDAESTDELKRELKRGLSLTHPGIVRVYRFEQDDTGAAIAMEYVDGPTLSSLKAKQIGGCFDVREIEGWVDQCCAALDYAHHEARIVHRDLKPRNLMLTSKGKLKIADFGVATSISDTVSRVSVQKSSGTPPYMSPQQAFGGDPSPSDDVYSLGATIYELLTGRPPFYQGNILAQVQQRVPPKMRERRAIFKVTGKAEIPDLWETTVAACLAKHPEDRPQSARHVLECLRGQRTPAVAEHAATQLDPTSDTLVGSDIDSTMTSVGIPLEEHATTERTTPSRASLPPEPPPGPARHAAPLPLPPRKSNAGAWVVLVLLVAFGAGAWWWQQNADRRDAGQERSLNPSSATHIAPPALPGNELSPAEMKASEHDAELAATKKIPTAGQPWENSLQMKFVPVPGTHVLFSIFETRVDDYLAFGAAGQKAKGEDAWPPTTFVQGQDHPAVNVSWEDAQAYCQWLTAQERASDLLGSQQFYRLPTDEEWSLAVGLPAEDGATPAARHQKIRDHYPWGNQWPPPDGAGNYMGVGDANPDLPDLKEKEIEGYKDGYTHTAPAGKFRPNLLGIYDLGGNAWEWVEDWFDERHLERTLRGGGWVFLFDGEALSSSRLHAPPMDRLDYYGFRVVLDPGPQK